MKNKQTTNDSSDRKECRGCKKISFFLKYNMCQTCTVEKQFQEKETEASSNLLSSTKCNYLDCKYNSLVTIKCNDTSCNNWFHHTCQSEYNCAKYENGFDSIHSVKKRCSVCVDKMIETFSKSVDTENKHIHILFNNKPADVIGICEDNEEVDDVDTNVVIDEIINEVTEKVTDEIINEITEEVVDTNN